MTQFLRIWFTEKYVTKCYVKINIFLSIRARNLPYVNFHLREIFFFTFLLLLLDEGKIEKGRGKRNQLFWSNLYSN